MWKILDNICIFLVFFISKAIGKNELTLTSTIVQQWSTNLQLIQVTSPIPKDAVSIIKTRESHQFIYFGLHNGQIAISNAGYFSHLSYISVTRKDHIKLIDIIPIFREMMVVSFESESMFYVVFISLNYTQFNVQDDGIHHILNFTNPVIMHFSERNNELLIIHYNSAEIFHITVYAPIDLEWHQFTSTDIFINKKINIDEEDKLYCTETEYDSYILTTNTGCNTAYQLDPKYTINKLDFTLNSWSSMPESSQSISLYSPMFGYISSSCIFKYTTDQKLDSIAINWMQTTLKQHNINLYSIEAATMIQSGMDVGVLMIINDNSQVKKLMYFGGMMSVNQKPIFSQLQPIRSAHKRRLLMGRVDPHALNARHGRIRGDALRALPVDQPRSRSKLPPRHAFTPPQLHLNPLPTTTNRPRLNQRSRTPVARKLCFQQKLQAGIDCYINSVRYKIIKKLGFGADGDVFLAKLYANKDVTNDVALKQFTKRKSFQREVTVLMLLKECSHAVHLIDVSPYKDETGKAATTFIVVMEFVAGGDLKNFMLQQHQSVKASLPLSIFRRYLQDLSEPLSIMNNNLNFMHTDIKPDNILVALGFEYPDDEPNIDFILADMSVSLTYDQFDSGSYSGTRLWFSPEMTAAVHFKTHKMRSKECVDAYGLVLVGIHLYGSLCSSKGHVDPLCALANTFKQALSTFERNYGNNKVLAYENLFKSRSDATSAALLQLETQASHPQSSAGYKRASEILRVVSSFLIRYPDSTKKYPYIFSAPSSCINWSTFKRLVLEVRYIQT